MAGMGGDFKGQISMQERAAWIAGQKMVSDLSNQALQTEKKLDAAIAEMDNMGEQDFAKLRAQRLEAMKKKQEKMQEWKQLGHGRYQEIPDQPRWFEEAKLNERMICHFYRGSTWRCEIMDKHLERLAPKHMETRIIKIDAEKCPFLCERLNIVLLPTLILCKDGDKVDAIEGFEQLGGTDDFTTDTLEKRLAFCQVIDYDGDLTGGIQGKKFQMGKAGKGGAQSKSVRKGRRDFYESDNESDYSD